MDDLWNDDPNINLTWVDNPSPKIVEAHTGAEDLISTWSMFLDCSTLLEVGNSLRNSFEPVVQIFCPPLRESCLHFNISEWSDISAIKTEHNIRLMLKSTDQLEHEVFVGYGIKITLADCENGSRGIRISQGFNSIVLTEEAVNRFLSAVHFVHQKLDFLSDYSTYWYYQDFADEVADDLCKDGLFDEQNILSRGKFFCQNLKLLKKLVAHSSEIVNIHPQRFVKDVTEKMLKEKQ
ncbi:uncharacterized protein LOC116166519 [Photinus pyralis]|uniref:uncharacterized protein LOC116166519 n=1 Tax=Photinus pyralis TaxID=7054 RepID=UPI001266E7D0|nr:uncharacterized protein LOC116166519 [Photinus pyralis]